MKLLYIFPHPDDESFGPAAAMNRQKREGHEVHLLTLTHGEATSQRIKLGVSKAEMADIRFREMECVKKRLQLDSMEVLDFPDNQLKELDPRKLESAIKERIVKIQPDIVVSYPVHGISGFHDHLVTHAVVKRVYLEMKDRGANYLKRLAFFTVPDDESDSFQDGVFRMIQSKKPYIDCVFELSDDDRAALSDCLDCYKTYREVIEKTNVFEKIGGKVHFELFMEDCKPPIRDLTAGI